MANLFYLLGFFFIIHEISILGNPKGYLKKLRLLKREEESEDGYESESGRRIVKTSWELLNDEEKAVVRLTFFSLFYFAWLVIGCCFSGQWIGFVSLTAFGFAIGYIRKKFDKSTRKSLSIIKFDAFISVLALAFLIINHFHNII